MGLFKILLTSVQDDVLYIGGCSIRVSLDTRNWASLHNSEADSFTLYATAKLSMMSISITD